MWLPARGKHNRTFQLPGFPQGLTTPYIYGRCVYHTANSLHYPDGLHVFLQTKSLHRVHVRQGCSTTQGSHTHQPSDHSLQDNILNTRRTPLYQPIHDKPTTCSEKESAHCKYQLY